MAKSQNLGINIIFFSFFVGIVTSVKQDKPLISFMTFKIFIAKKHNDAYLVYWSGFF